MKEFLKLNNFNSLAQIMSGLENIAIDRLKPLHDILPPKTKETAKHLSEVISPSDNYRSYRSFLALSPRIPFIGSVPFLFPLDQEMERWRDEEMKR